MKEKVWNTTFQKMVRPYSYITSKNSTVAYGLSRCIEDSCSFFYILMLHQTSATLYHQELSLSSSIQLTALSESKATNSAEIYLLYVQNV
jgi:hypothetical protein